MSGLSYIGRDAANPTEITSRRVANSIISTATPNQTSVQNEVNLLTQITGPNPNPTYAPLAYVNGQDSTFEQPSYWQTQDALLVPKSAVGVAQDWRLWDATWRAAFDAYVASGPSPVLNYPSWLATQTTSGTPSAVWGVAGLDGTSKVPVPQMPVLGSGYIQGPYGYTATFTGSTSSTPMKIADWNIGLTTLSFRPLVFMQVFVLGAMSHPVIEVRIANSTVATSYAGSLLVGRGLGRSLYNDYCTVSVLPNPDTTSETPSNLGPNYNVWLSAWLYDLNGQTVTMDASNYVASGTAFLLRGV